MRLAGILLVTLLAACSRKPEEVVGPDPKGSGGPPSGGAGVKSEPLKVEPAKGPIDLATATAGISGSGPLYADLETEKGKLECKLLEDKAPVAVANFVGLARGLQAFKDPMTGTWVKRPAYDGTAFHRIIKGFMIQGGDPTGSGTGDPGYVFADEVWAGSKHDRAGLLCMANKGPNTNGMQFFVTDGAAAWLDGGYTIFGECGPVEVVHALANVPVMGEKPVNKPRITKVTIRR
jgi:peptidyl-prolyl cis-trans isomerase A (cyclophilin A)